MKRVLLFLGGLVVLTTADFAQNYTASVESQRALVNQYCVACHNDKLKSGGFSWTEVDLAHPNQSAERVEKIIRKVRSGMMPPAGARRPDEPSLRAFAASLELQIDQAAARQPRITSPKLHRLNRTEYRNSIRDLLDIDVDVATLLPPDARSGGFDNMSDALSITPALMESYIRTADKISRLAVGDPQISPSAVYYNVPKVVNQMRHVEGAPIGTRGGISVIHNFPVDGEYTFRVAPHYRYDGGLWGTSMPDSLGDQQIEVSVDGVRVGIFTIDPRWANEVDETALAYLVTPPIKIQAGSRRLSAAFLSKSDGPEQDLFKLAEQSMADSLGLDQAGMT